MDNDLLIPDRDIIYVYEYPSEKEILYMNMSYRTRETGKVAKGENISGKRVLELMDIICKWLDVISCYVYDEAQIVHGNISFPLSTITLILYGVTYYEKNGFKGVYQVDPSIYS